MPPQSLTFTNGIQCGTVQSKFTERGKNSKWRIWEKAIQIQGKNNGSILKQEYKESLYILYQEKNENGMET